MHSNSSGELRALTIRQPWAWAILLGGKTVENRTWSTPFRGRFYVHASAKPDRAAYGWLADRGVTPPADLPMGQLLGTVEVVDVVDADPDHPWHVPGFDRHWILEAPQVLDRPVPMAGTTMLWKFDAAALIG